MLGVRCLALAVFLLSSSPLCCVVFNPAGRPFTFNDETLHFLPCSSASTRCVLLASKSVPRYPAFLRDVEERHLAPGTTRANWLSMRLQLQPLVDSCSMIHDDIQKQAIAGYKCWYWLALRRDEITSQSIFKSRTPPNLSKLTDTARFIPTWLRLSPPPSPSLMAFPSL